MDIMQWLTQNPAGEFCFTILVSMVPVVELRGGIPFGVARGLPVWAAYLAAIIGNMLPVPFILVYIRRIFQWMRRRLPWLNSLVDRLERKAHLKGRTVSKYKYLGLILFVAVPLPGTGAWTGSLVAAVLNIRMRHALPAILLGLIMAGLITTALTLGVVHLL